MCEVLYQLRPSNSSAQPSKAAVVDAYRRFIYFLNNSFHFLSKVILEAIPKDETDQARRYRGYIAVDDLTFESGDNCQGHCTFDSGMCGFLNDNSRDDFDWEVVRTKFFILMMHVRFRNV